MKVIFYIILLFFSFLSACKKEGCMDKNAINYNPNAKKSDGSCNYNYTKEPTTEPMIHFVFEFDSNQVRLNNIGLPASIPSGNAAQNPKMNVMVAHYLELATSAFTQLGQGNVLFHASETNLGGENAIDFSKVKLTKNKEAFFSMPLKDFVAGEYEYLRVSLAYQNYDVVFHYDSIHNIPGVGNVHVTQDFNATVGSFVGFNTYIQNYMLKTQNITVNENKKQGYWGFETSGIIPSLNNYSFSYFTTGQAPEGATTVVNPIASTSPIPAGSCVVTAPFENGKLIITGNETKDVYIKVSLSTNNSFEWKDLVANGKWEPLKGEKIVDMGIRGMKLTIEK